MKTAALSLSAFLCLLTQAYPDSSVPKITLGSDKDDFPLTKISIPWRDPAFPLPGTDADPAKEIQVTLRGSPRLPQNGDEFIPLSNRDRTIFGINLKWATHTSLVYVILKDRLGNFHVFSLNKQILSLFPKDFHFPASDDIQIQNIVGNCLQLYSVTDSGHYWCDFQATIEPSGQMKLIRFKTHHLSD